MPRRVVLVAPGIPDVLPDVAEHIVQAGRGGLFRSDFVRSPVCAGPRPGAFLRERLTLGCNNPLRLARQPVTVGGPINVHLGQHVVLLLRQPIANPSEYLLASSIAVVTRRQPIVFRKSVAPGDCIRPSDVRDGLVGAVFVIAIVHAAHVAFAIVDIGRHVRPDLLEGPIRYLSPCAVINLRV